ncbi:MAG: lipid II flippase Amj family protein [Bacillota bacterium]|uniref:Lipid II flippase Amj n=2 Tax=Carboxydocella TaxID=178898 RepID=A0A1T4RAX7_9FIRM|nr:MULTISPECIES: lipid II flippase Amj family protein [Carboxydocella]AVX19407.1 Protein of unknown function (DUF2837) [Carboxydocella thermautotrophica]GAW31988.1 hypothetical protein JDF658_17530 [Carboxydocella sp. JDF658]SKA13212.1 Protein of unknown function [Carboxydocella sporoproducens DSM 16521]
MESRLWVVMIFTALLHLISTLAYSVRLAGVKTKRLAIAFSLWNVIFLLASTANTIQGPLFASLVDDAIHTITAGVGKLEQTQLEHLAIYQSTLAGLTVKVRLVLLAAFAGTVLGTLLVPSFVRIFSRLILLFEKVGSVPKMVVLLLHPGKLRQGLKEIKPPSLSHINKVRQGEKLPLPGQVFLLNVLATGLATTGVLSAMFAGAMNPRFSTTAVTLSAIVNGFATVFLATAVDPQVASLTDQALRGVREEEEVAVMVKYLSFSRIAGTLFAQLITVPAAQVIAWTATLLKG